jgi:plastocyanin domain-containing protein
MQKPGPKPRILAATVVALAAMGLTACAAGTPAAAPATTVTQTAQPSSAPVVSSPAAVPSAQASGSADSSSAGRLPDYQPSTVVSKSEYSTVLTSPDSVGKVGEFYRKALAAGGWHVTSSSMSAYQASFSANRSNEGVNVSVYSRGSGSGISISTHPQ